MTKKYTKSTNGVDKNENGAFKDGRKSKLFFTPDDQLLQKTTLEDLRQSVFIDRYSLKAEDGSAMEKYPEQMWRRVAKGISQFEETGTLQREWEEKFYSVMEGFKFVPGGRILSGAGTGYEVTFFNCYVIPSPEDSRGGIMENITQTVEIQSRAGGVGVNLSSLRPRGARVRKVNGTSSGPVNWAALYSTANHDVIQQGGSRRGALMLMLNDWHPDVIEFIKVKEDLTKIPGANLSVCVSDKFMEAVKNDGEWNLIFPDYMDDPSYDEKWDGDIDKWQEEGGKVVVYKTVKAREIWKIISEAAWRSAEPGLHFIERSNKRSNTWYFEKLIATNPCITGDTWVSTKEGLLTIQELYERGVNTQILTDSRLSSNPYHPTSKILQTGIKEVYKLQTKEGFALKLTGDHQVLTETGWKRALDLKKGDEILISNRKGGFGSTGSLEEGRVLGWLVGDGTMKAAEAVLSFFGDEKFELAPQFVQMVDSLVDIKQGSSRSYPIGVRYVKGRDEARVQSTRLWRYAFSHGIKPGEKLQVPFSVVKGNEDMQRGFLQALFTADGHASGSVEKGLSVRLTSISLNLLQDVQKLLLNFGIVSKIYKDRRTAQSRFLPDGFGGLKQYNCKAYHDLVISKKNIEVFAKEISFLAEYKNRKIIDWLKSLIRGAYKENYLVKFDRLVKLGFETVYDLTEPATSSFIANGLVVHNCGEQPLGAWAVCNLGAMNLSAYVDKSGKFDFDNLGKDVQVAMRFMDNVVDANFYFYPETQTTQMNIRRTGLGTMGLGDALIKMKLTYGSDASVEIIEKIYKTIRDNAYIASSMIAAEKGSFLKYDKEKFLKGYFIKRLPKYIRELIAKNGIRNAVLLTQAPTGTTSLLAGVSSGIEPVYNFEFKRKDRIGEHIVYHPLYQEWKENHPNQEKPPYFVCAMDLSPEDHLKVQAKVQEYTDSSISKTVNAPNSYTVEDVDRLYTLAYEWGCKGITFFRDGSRAGVLENITSDKPREKKSEKEEKLINGHTNGATLSHTNGKVEDGQLPFSPEAGASLINRPFMVRGATYKLKTPVGSAFITINQDEGGEPLEMFINIGRAGSDVAAMADALGRTISTALRFRGSLPPRERAHEIAEQLSGIGGRSSVGFGPNKIRSLPDAISVALSAHFNFKLGAGGKSDLAEAAMTADGSAIAGHAQLSVSHPDRVAATAESPFSSETQDLFETELAPGRKIDLCPSCGAHALVYEEGCAKCYSCGHAEC